MGCTGAMLTRWTRVAARETMDGRDWFVPAGMRGAITHACDSAVWVLFDNGIEVTWTHGGEYERTAVHVDLVLLRDAHATALAQIDAEIDDWKEAR